MQISDLIFIDETGYHYADFPTILAWLQGQYQGVYGADVYLGNDSQDGQWIAIMAQAFFDVGAQGAATYNSFSPVTAQGAGLARVVKINGLEKRIPTNSTVELTLVGTANTVLTNCIAIDTLQQQWSIPTTTIPGPGTITVTATSITPGAIAALPNTVTGLFTPTQGWQSVNNANAATIGVGVEQDAALRERQAESVALPSLSVFEGTEAAVANVAGVTAVRGYENDGITTDSNGLPPSSISLVVLGGIDTAVAQAIQVTKGPGCKTFGTTNIPVVDSRGMPLTINFFRPTQATIGAQVTITELTGWDASTIALIQNALSAAIIATQLGGDIIITKLYLTAYLIGTPQYGTYNIVSIELSKNGGGLGTSDIQLLFNEEAVCDPVANVSVIT